MQTYTVPDTEKLQKALKSVSETSPPRNRIFTIILKLNSARASRNLWLNSLYSSVYCMCPLYVYVEYV